LTTRTISLSKEFEIPNENFILKVKENRKRGSGAKKDF